MRTHPSLSPTRTRALALLVPTALGLALSLLMRPELATLAAPLLGPWAGRLYGHRECTMAATLPACSWGGVGLGLVAIVATLAARKRAWRFASVALLAVWSLVWNGLALLSLVNTLE